MLSPEKIFKQAREIVAVQTRGDEALMIPSSAESASEVAGIVREARATARFSLFSHF
jgi:hypothetical protein